MPDFSDLIGKPFEWGGRGPDHFDCYGLCIEVYRRIGKDLIDYTSFNEKSLIRDMILDGKEKMFQTIDAPEAYCFVTFKMHPKYVTHLGIVLEDKDQFVHCIQKKNVCRERLSNPIWARRIEGFYRYVRN